MGNLKAFIKEKRLLFKDNMVSKWIYKKKKYNELSIMKCSSYNKNRLRAFHIYLYT